MNEDEYGIPKEPERKKKSKKILGSYKKDSLGLFDGGYKASVFDTKEEKQERKRKSTRDYMQNIEDND